MADAWSIYEARFSSFGHPNSRDRELTLLQERTNRCIRSSLSYKNVLIDCVEREVIIEDTPDFNVKKIFSMPTETLPHGGLVEWMNNIWLITELDANDEVRAEGKIKQCNFKLRWLNDEHEIEEQWCIVEDGTKYLVGEKNSSIMSIGDARIAITVPKNNKTVRIRRGQRFLVDDVDSDEVLAYQITKPNRFFNLYNGEGIYRYILNEVNVTDNDNKDLRIADYFNWKPRTESITPDTVTDDSIDIIAEKAISSEETKGERIERTKGWL